MLKLIDYEDNFILWKTEDILEVLKKKIEKLLGKDKDGKRIIMRAYDIKNFYTNLDHDEIRKAYLWLVGMARSKQRNFKFVNVPKCKEDVGNIGREFVCDD